MVRRPRCAYCKKAFTPKKRGRAPKYCCAAHRQAAWASQGRPALLWRRHYDDFRTREGIRRAVIDVLRELGYEPPAPKKPRSSLRLVKDDKGEQ
jgi:hypothetical protein